MVVHSASQEHLGIKLMVEGDDDKQS